MVRIVSLIALAALFASPASARDAPPAEPSLKARGGVTLVSQYHFRGIGLSDEKPALQGTINLNHDSGFYAGVWGSSIDGLGDLGGSNLELDLYGGYKTEIATGVTLDAGLLYYAYPGSTGGDFKYFEPYANVSGSIGPATLKAGGAFAPAQDGIGGNLLDMVRIEAGALNLTLDPIDLTDAVASASHDLRAALASHPLNLDVSPD